MGPPVAPADGAKAGNDGDDGPNRQDVNGAHRLRPLGAAAGAPELRDAETAERDHQHEHHPQPSQQLVVGRSLGPHQDDDADTDGDKRDVQMQQDDGRDGLAFGHGRNVRGRGLSVNRRIGARRRLSSPSPSYG